MILQHEVFCQTGWLSSCHRSTVWHIKVSQLWSCLSLMQWTIWYVGSVFVNWNYDCRVGDLDSVQWALLQPCGGAESLNMWQCCVFWYSKENYCRSTKLLKAIHLKKTFATAKTVGPNGLLWPLWNISPRELSGCFLWTDALQEFCFRFYAKEL